MNRQKDGNLEKPKSMTRPKVWTEAVEEAYRFQLAGYRDELEYKSIKSVAEVGLHLGLCDGEGGCTTHSAAGETILADQWW